MVNVLFVNWVFCFKIARNGNFLALSFSKMASVSLIKSLMRMYLLMSVVINVPCISVKQLRNNGLFILVIIEKCHNFIWTSSWAPKVPNMAAFLFIDWLVPLLPEQHLEDCGWGTGHRCMTSFGSNLKKENHLNSCRPWHRVLSTDTLLGLTVVQTCRLPLVLWLNKPQFA